MTNGLVGKPPGSPKTGGRLPGSANTMSGDAKKQLQQAFMGLGGVPNLIKWGKQNETAFYNLWSRIIPREITGKGGGPIAIIAADIGDLSEEDKMRVLQQMLRGNEKEEQVDKYNVDDVAQEPQTIIEGDYSVSE
jgi:hypothetical protein